MYPEISFKQKTMQGAQGNQQQFQHHPKKAKPLGILLNSPFRQFSTKVYVFSLKCYGYFNEYDTIVN